MNRHLLPPALSVILCGLVLAIWACAPATPLTPAPVRFAGAALEPPTALPQLTFARSDGGTFTTADTRGRISLFFFGYTHCADVCPLTLAQMTQLRKSLGNQADVVDIYFVTLDPERDTPERIQSYMANFPGVVGLRGAENQIAAAQASFHVVSQRQYMADGDYMLDHTAAIYLVNPASEIQLVYPYGTDPSDIVADVRAASP